MKSKKYLPTASSLPRVIQKRISLTSEELEKILMACARTGVVQLEYRGLNVQFGPQKEKISKNVKLDLFGKPIVPADPVNEAKVEEESLLHAELRLREEQKQMALIEDPELYEEIMSREAHENANL